MNNIDTVNFPFAANNIYNLETTSSMVEEQKLSKEEQLFRRVELISETRDDYKERLKLEYIMKIYQNLLISEMMMK